MKNGIYYFSKKDKLKLHEENVHTNKKMTKSIQEYVCDLCMKKLSTKANLIRHIENVHVKMEKSTDVTSTKNRQLVRKFKRVQAKKTREIKY